MIRRALLKEGKTLLSMYGVLDRSRVDDEFALTDEFREHLEAVYRSRPPEVAKRPWMRFNLQEKRGLVGLAVLRWLFTGRRRKRRFGMSSTRIRR